MEALVGRYTQKNSVYPRLTENNGVYLFVGKIVDKATGPFSAIGDILTHLGLGLIYSYE